ncbi:hypothetical protein [Halorubrum trueperi]|uniref:DUF7991 domain-containing protein n=1 Tax=Halorubrum trueperi TaxID=2004704 RepID=A0ABD5UMY8_9EURY
MLALIGFVSLIALVAAHTLVAGMTTRFFRLRLSTSWGAVVYTIVLTPMLLLFSTLFFTGVVNVGVGIDLGSPTIVFGLLIALPIVLGAAIDYLYVPSPEEYELPEAQ